MISLTARSISRTNMTRKSDRHSAAGRGRTHLLRRVEKKYRDRPDPQQHREEVGQKPLRPVADCLADARLRTQGEARNRKLSDDPDQHGDQQYDQPGTQRRKLAGPGLGGHEVLDSRGQSQERDGDRRSAGARPAQAHRGSRPTLWKWTASPLVFPLTVVAASLCGRGAAACNALAAEPCRPP